MKTLVYSIHGFDKISLEKAAAGKHEIVFTVHSLNDETAALSEGYEAAALFTSDNASAEVLKKMHACGIKYITLRGAGYDHIDLPTAKTLGIKVANVPAYSPYAIAEHAVALLLALNRKLIPGQQLMQTGDYRSDQLTGFDLHGKTIGIVGIGKIGAAFARIMHGFGCKVLGFDIQENELLAKETGIRYTSLTDLCKQSDVISLHCPLNKTTRYLFNSAVFAEMKKGIVFINTARGGLVNTLDLIEALDNGTVSAAGLDVYEHEKPIFFHDHREKTIHDELFLKLRSNPHVLITGHQAFITREALEGIANTTIANLDSWESGLKAENELEAT